MKTEFKKQTRRKKTPTKQQTKKQTNQTKRTNEKAATVEAKLMQATESGKLRNLQYDPKKHLLCVKSTAMKH